MIRALTSTAAMALTLSGVPANAAGLQFVEMQTFRGRLPTKVAWAPSSDQLALLTETGLEICSPTSPSPSQAFKLDAVTDIAWRLDSKYLVCRTRVPDDYRKGTGSIVVLSAVDGTGTRLLERTTAIDPRFDSTGVVALWRRDSGRQELIDPRVLPQVRPSQSVLMRSFRATRSRDVSGPGSSLKAGRAPHASTSAEDRMPIAPRLYLDTFPDGRRLLVAIEGESAWHTAVVTTEGALLQDLGPRLPGHFVGNSVSPAGDRVIGVIAAADDPLASNQPLAVMSLNDLSIARVEDVERASFPQYSRVGAFIAFQDPATGNTRVGMLNER